MGAVIQSTWCSAVPASDFITRCKEWFVIIKSEDPRLRGVHFTPYPQGKACKAGAEQVTGWKLKRQKDLAWSSSSKRKDLSHNPTFSPHLFTFLLSLPLHGQREQGRRWKKKSFRRVQRIEILSDREGIQPLLKAGP